VEYISKLLTKITEFASTTSVHTLDLIKTCNNDGFNMFHVAVIYKRMDIMHMILEYGTGKVCYCWSNYTWYYLTGNALSLF